MIEILENNKYNRRITPSDWRYSAAIVGMNAFFTFCYIKTGERINYHLTEDYMEYNFEDVDLNNPDQNVYHMFLDFVQERYSKYLSHCILESIVTRYVNPDKDMPEDTLKVVKERLKNPTICKKVFKDIKDPKSQKEEILDLIEKNRYELIAETYNKAKSMYIQFIHDGSFRKSKKDMKGISRLDGYYVDLGKKKKSLGYNFEFNNSIFNDEFEFEYIPFAFTNTRKAYFINCSVDCRLLCKTYDTIQKKVEEEAQNRNIPEASVLKHISDYLKYDVEIITKEIDKTYESLILRKQAIDIFQSIPSNIVASLKRKMKCGDDYIDVSGKVAEAIVEKIRLDDFILQAMKETLSKEVILNIIDINIKIYGGDEKMEKNTYIAKCKAEEVVQVFIKRNTKNKITSYRQKLIAALNFKDYEKFNTILLQLSSYSGVSFDFAYELFDDFSGNKNTAFAFVNALSEKNQNVKENN